MTATASRDETAFLSNEDLAERYRTTVGTVRDWRQRGIGPIATKINGLVRYALADVLRWEQERRESEAR